MQINLKPQLERRAIKITGVVQGVGFRPFVFGLASQLGLTGFVKNQTGSVLIEVQGAADCLDRFSDEVVKCAPPLARIEQLSVHSITARQEDEFSIQTSDHDLSEDIFISPDVATCAACLSELFDPHNRRYRYAFINCTHCGPRLTIVTGAPYDRSSTTMAGFTLHLSGIHPHD